MFLKAVIRRGMEWRGCLKCNWWIDCTVHKELIPIVLNWREMSCLCSAIYVLIFNLIQQMLWLWLWLSDLYSASPQISHRTRSALQHSLVQGLSVCRSFVRRSHLLPDQLPGEHSDDMAAVFSASACGNIHCFCIRLVALSSHCFSWSPG